MGFLTEWLTTIILLILLATILEMLLPNSAMQRYVKMVVGLLLLFIILHPLLSILNKDIDSWLFSISNETNEIEHSVANSINLQKREIENGQRAYISEQIAVQLESQVKTALREKFNLAIVEMEVELDGMNDLTLMEQQLKLVNVQVQKIGKEEIKDRIGRINQVEDVQIDTSVRTSEEPIQVDNRLVTVRQFLSNQWNLPEKTILLTWEGGGVWDEAR